MSMKVIIGIPAIPNSHNEHQNLFFQNLVNNVVITRPDSIKTICTMQLFTTFRHWIFPKCFYLLSDLALYLLWQVLVGFVRFP